MNNTECLWCKKSIAGEHFNKKYCCSKCVNKARYEKYGQRSTPQQRHDWYFKRISNPKYLDRLRKQGNIRNKKIKEFIAKYKINLGCMDCGYNDHHVALDFDHVKGMKKINVSLSKSITQAKKEIKKCEVVCSNCHRIRTYKKLKGI